MNVQPSNIIPIVLTAATLSAHAFDLDDYNAKYGNIEARLALNRIKATPLAPAAAPKGADKGAHFALKLKKPELDAVADAAKPAAPIFNEVELKDIYRASGEAFTSVMAKCEGRFTEANNTLQRSMRREEKVALAGGAAGLYGTIATCPHCAAVGAGLAGLASLFQKTAANVGDDAQTARAQLEGIAAKIQEDIKAYHALPDPLTATNMSDFSSQIGKRKQQLDVMAADSSFYYVTFKAATEDKK